MIKYMRKKKLKKLIFEYWKSENFIDANKIRIKIRQLEDKLNVVDRAMLSILSHTSMDLIDEYDRPRHLSKLKTDIKEATYRYFKEKYQYNILYFPNSKMAVIFNSVLKSMGYDVEGGSIDKGDYYKECKHASIYQHLGNENDGYRSTVRINIDILDGVILHGNNINYLEDTDIVYYIDDNFKIVETEKVNTTNEYAYASKEILEEVLYKYNLL